MIFKLLTISSLFLDLARPGPTEDFRETGDPTIVRQHPYYVTIMKDGLAVCGGALIEANIVVTAASCVVEGLSVRAGSTYTCREDPNIPAQVSPVKKFRIHPKFNKTTNDYDVALLFTADFFTRNVNVAPIELDQPGMAYTRQALTIGMFPSVDEPVNIIPPCRRMRTKSLTVDYLRVPGPNISETQLAFTNKYKVQSIKYKDDSNAFRESNQGSPVINLEGNRRLVGILSKQENAGDAKIDIATRVSNSEILRFINVPN